MDSARKQLVEKLQSANHILVTVSRNPSVDQLSACIGLTLVLNKLGKHGTAVFSGEVPSTMEFLQPNDTIEKNTDSLRDFIIALDKAKADKLRYKVEDNVVRIFITPYKTSITEADLDFSQGDFNVDVVVALGVQNQEDLDEAITSHGRILHDATVATMNIASEGSLGSINWNDPASSSLCELVTELAQTLGSDLLDAQVSTALLTGIVAETARFSNEKTSPQTMSLSAALMAAGANQQLVASKLEEPAPVPEKPIETDQKNPDQESENHSDAKAETDSGNQPEPAQAHDGFLNISHEEEAAQEAKSEENPPPTPEADLKFDSNAFETNDEKLEEKSVETAELPPVDETPSNASRLMTEPPALGGKLTANSDPEALDPSTDILSLPSNESGQLLNHGQSASADAKLDQPPSLPDEPISTKQDTPSPELTPQPAQELTPEPSAQPAASTSFTPVMPGFTPPPPAWVPPSNDPFNLEPAPESNDEQTLMDIEAAVKEKEKTPETVDAARDEVIKALNSDRQPLEPTQALNAQPLFDSATASQDASGVQASQAFTDVLQQNIPTLPTPPGVISSPTPIVSDPTAPPPVPPPIPFNFGVTPDQTKQ